ncbi:Protein of unknown function (DUF2795) [Rubrobacter radiotolerans]|uniref:DUF2795 domain-containing protein n=1 Tax=Rubrobacter radiotolerans TaxID=42256 RepID=A0A023X3I6_RUBRA|nr:DUF2795 domain-containing protein [Rubrobacter radiotolerans]AHY46918.1 Protein of unknown function (DUF2795) [Rubrobacter radiotolerans]MDX5894323.1 DUF2795 domain-containing protein [Rubrobacter radiotolerans]SMC05736.1 Protein of unknown function [Rubrobacter radiotolerans DSM 5868]
MDLKGMSQEDKEKYLGRAEYPADRDAVLKTAESSDAPPELLEGIRSLPENDRFSGPQDVFAAITGLPRVRTPK